MVNINGRSLYAIITYLAVFSVAVSTNHSLGEVVYRKYVKPATNLHDIAQEGDNVDMAGHIWVDQVFTNKKGEFLILKNFTAEPLQEGTVVDIRRQTTDHNVATGVAKITAIHDRYITAKVSKSATDESRLLLRRYPNIMVGDLAVPKRFSIIRTTHISPTKVISFMSLFRDPYAYPNTYELSPAGKEVLSRISQVFRNSKLPKLIVEGHTDAEGPTDTNQVESYQRALTIRQYLVNELGFDSERVIAIGMGEMEPIEEPYLPDHKRNARRIVIKVKSY